MKQEILETALEAFWASIAKSHPERESGDLSPSTTYDLELWAQKAYEEWLEMNKPVFYVQRTTTEILRITGSDTFDAAENYALTLVYSAQICEDVMDADIEIVQLDRNGKAL